jgi:BON domain-containing protein
MRRYVFSFALIATAVLGPPMALGNDQQIAQTIVERLQAQKKSGHLKGFSLDLQVESGEVWLTGRVSSQQQQALALDIARRVPGVKQVVNDITVDQTSASRNLFASLGGKVRQAVGQEDQQAPPAVGTGVEGGNAYYAGTAPAPIPAPIAGPMPQQYAGPLPQHYYARPNMPMAYAPARTIAHQNGGGPGDVAGPADALGAGPVPGAINGQPMPMHIPGSAIGMAPARYDHPHMPGYAWPSYASYPNYAAVTYPKQYSPTAWPYIGPFYPYPQVPLGWRKVTLEWDDGWWMLDFKDRRH